MVINGFTEEICKCGSGIVRIGPEATEYGKRYDFAVVYKLTDSGTAVVKALVVPRVPWYLRWLIRVPSFTTAHAVAIRRAIRRAVKDDEFEVVFERHKDS